MAACEGTGRLQIVLTDFVQLVQAMFRMVAGTHFLHVLGWPGTPGPGWTCSASAMPSWWRTPCSAAGTSWT